MEIFFEEKIVYELGEVTISKTRLLNFKSADSLKTDNYCYVHTCFHDEKNDKGENRPCTRVKL